MISKSSYITQDLHTGSTDDVQVLVSSQLHCDICSTSPDLVIEPRSFSKDLMTVYGMNGSYQVRHMVKRCSGFNTGFMYGYRVLDGRLKKYDLDCLTRRILGTDLNIWSNNTIHI